ncbi:LLM class flavin-dependent oxidoreductase [Nostocoides sp. F2B08]|uniref:LLM class flavin-dependent oxidoreductase n=1 Tax=Nostocoides sp. F2B08 TaxID=2653936 RepID=UPI00186B2B00|nr:LLM class flavin-dependent oxidoreductase [Tetrasphaera sp. F2B08]
MGRISVGCVLNRLALTDASGRRAIVLLADSAGLDHLGFGDHVSFHTGAGSDGLLAAAGALAVSDRLAANTGVYLLPLRHPMPVARQLADIAALAPGRFVFGVGIGGEDPHEVQNCGVDPRTRGRRTDEALQIVRKLLTGDAVDVEGDHFTLEGARIAPAPQIPIPIVVGGRSDAAIRRAGRLGDGWFGIWVSPERYRQSLTSMQEAAGEVGRVPRLSVNALNVWCGVGDDRGEARGHVGKAMQQFYGIPYERFQRWSPAGTPAEVADFLAPYVDAGCTLFNLIINGRSAEHEIEAAGTIRDRILQLTGGT